MLLPLNSAIRYLGIALVSLQLLGLFPSPALADRIEQSFHADRNGHITVFKTLTGERVGASIINQNVGLCFTLKWTDFGETDREIIFAPPIIPAPGPFGPAPGPFGTDQVTQVIQKEAFFTGGMMDPFDDFFAALSLNVVVVWPFLSDANELIDIFVGVDLTTWFNSPVPFSFGDVIPIVNGRNNALLPGYLIGTAPISFVPGVGWGTPQPLNGNVTVRAVRDGASTPEPSTIILSGIGSLGLVGYCWRRRKRTA